jgi:hypothetical protein
MPIGKKESLQMGTMSKLLFIAQENCYAFYLIHGAVLVFLMKTLKISGLNLFALGILLTSIGAIVIERITKPIINLAANKAIHLTPISLRSIGVHEL